MIAYIVSSISADYCLLSKHNNICQKTNKSKAKRHVLCSLITCQVVTVTLLSPRTVFELPEDKGRRVEPPTVF